MREGKKMSESEIRATSERLYRGVGVVERDDALEELHPHVQRALGAVHALERG